MFTVNLGVASLLDAMVVEVVGEVMIVVGEVMILLVEEMVVLHIVVGEGSIFVREMESAV